MICIGQLIGVNNDSLTFLFVFNSKFLTKNWDNDAFYVLVYTYINNKIYTGLYLHDGVWAHRAHGKEVEYCEED